MRSNIPWLPMMGEFHYARYPHSEWRKELLQMKACGVDIAATYVFWIHHEAEEGCFDSTGCRDLRALVEECHRLRLPMWLCLHQQLPYALFEGMLCRLQHPPAFMDGRALKPKRITRENEYRVSIPKKSG